MRDKLHRFLRRWRPVTPLTLAVLAVAVAFLAVTSTWAFQAVGDYLIFGPAVFGGSGEPGTPHPTATTTATATLTDTATATATATLTATGTPTATPTATPTLSTGSTPTRTPKPTKTPKPTRTPKTTATATATVTLTPSPTATPAPGEELLVFDLNREVTTADHGFPWDKPPLAAANIDWTQPVNFAEGTLYLRVEIFDQPMPQNMKLEFCFWQANNTLENCSSRVAVSGQSGTVVTWSTPVKKMWKKDGLPINWALPRDRNGVAIRNSAGEPVSDYSGWDWSGEIPGEWYPLDMRFTVVVAEKGAGFSGWDTYIP